MISLLHWVVVVGNASPVSDGIGGLADGVPQDVLRFGSPAAVERDVFAVPGSFDGHRREAP